MREFIGGYTAPRTQSWMPLKCRKALIKRAILEFRHRGWVFEKNAFVARIRLYQREEEDRVERATQDLALNYAVNCAEQHEVAI
jgi:hypothetical protein